MSVTEACDKKEKKSFHQPGVMYHQLGEACITSWGGMYHLLERHVSPAGGGMHHLLGEACITRPCRPCTATSLSLFRPSGKIAAYRLVFSFFSVTVASTRQLSVFHVYFQRDPLQAPAPSASVDILCCLPRVPGGLILHRILVHNTRAQPSDL